MSSTVNIPSMSGPNICINSKNDNESPPNRPVRGALLLCWMHNGAAVPSLAGCRRAFCQAAFFSGTQRMIALPNTMTKAIAPMYA